MLDDLPPSGAWAGYYLYEHTDFRHRMRLNLTFTVDGSIHGDGVDDIAPSPGRARRLFSVYNFTRFCFGPA